MTSRQQKRREAREAEKMVAQTPIRVAVCIPARDHVPHLFAYDLAQLVGFTGARLGQNGIGFVQLIMSTGTLIAPQRIDLVDKAMEKGVTHILFIDSDMRFPKNALEHLVTCDKDIVGANYPRRAHPVTPTAYKRVTPNELLYTYEDSTGLEEADALGFGLVLVRADVFRKMPRPWFEIPYVPEEDGFQGEDVTFCQRARLSGYQIFVDHDLSRYIEHIGQIEFNWLHALDTLEVAGRTAQEAENGDSELHGASDGGGELAE